MICFFWLRLNCDKHNLCNLFNAPEQNQHWLPLCHPLLSAARTTNLYCVANGNQQNTRTHSPRVRKHIHGTHMLWHCARVARPGRSFRIRTRVFAGWILASIENGEGAMTMVTDR